MVLTIKRKITSLDFDPNVFENDMPKTKKTKKVNLDTKVRRLIKKNEIATTELKEYTNSFGGTLFPSTSGSVQSLTDDISQGDDMFNRTGRYIYMKQIRIRFSIETSITNWADCGRFFLVYDRQPNATTAAFTDIFQTASGASAGSAFKNTLVNSQRFTIVKEVMWDSCYFNRQYANYDIYFKVPDKLAHTVYPSASTTEAQSGSWLIAYGADRNTTTNTGMIVNAKVQFTDK